MHTLNGAKAEIVNPTVTRLLKTDLLHIEGNQLNVLTIHIAPGSVSKQVHYPGAELVYALEGVGVLEVEGKPPFALSPGAVTIVDSHHIHISKNSSPTHRLKCTAPVNLWTDRFSFATILFVKNLVASEAPLPKGYLVALARHSVTRFTTVSHPDHLDKFHCVSGIFPDAFSLSTN